MKGGWSWERCEGRLELDLRGMKGGWSWECFLADLVSVVVIFGLGINLDSSVKDLKA